MGRLREIAREFKTAVFETAIATFSTIITVDKLVILIRLDTSRSVAKKKMISVTRRVDATTTNEEDSALEPADKLKSSDRLGRESTRMAWKWITRHKLIEVIETD